MFNQWRNNLWLTAALTIAASPGFVSSQVEPNEQTTSLSPFYINGFLFKHTYSA